MMKVWIAPNSIRSRGIMVWGSPGAGKSRLLGLLALQDYVNGTPVIIFDVIGAVSDYFFANGKTDRVLYVDMSGKTGSVTPFPLYFRLGTESLHEISQRPLETFYLSDPALIEAPVQGRNPMIYVGAPLGMILSALNLPLTYAPSLLNAPNTWEDRFTQAISAFPEVAPAVSFFKTEYVKLHPSTISFRTKIAPILLDPALCTICCTSPGLNWAESINRHETVLLDFRHVGSQLIQRFLLLWTVRTLLAYLKHRGIGNHPPVSLVIDELKAIYTNDEVIAQELTELLNVYARNFNVWPLLATQDPISFGEKSRQSLLGLGSHIIGPVNNYEAARILAEALMTHDPMKVKASGGYVPTYYPLEEQIHLSAQQIQALQPFHFLVRPALSEGAISSKIYPVSIANVLNPWPDGRLPQLREELSKRSGIPVQPQQIAPIPEPKRATIQPHGKRRNLPPQDSDDDVS